MEPMFFEGPEKKVELVISDGRPSLRSLGDATWTAVVEAAGANILSKRSTGECDAYLLSESSLFVFDDHVTMITCGRTRLVDAVDKMLDTVGPEHVTLLVYERKNEHFPQQQETSFWDDARRLGQRIDGGAYRFGDEHSHCIELFHSSRTYRPDANDTTLEVLMHGLPERTAELFRGPRAGQSPASALGLDSLLTGFALDEHSFSPAGYSLNAVNGAYYYTIHVTPERVGSYVSFETNWDFRDQFDHLVTTVVNAFSPESFDVFAFCPDRTPLRLDVRGYRTRKHVEQQVCGYHVTFLHMYAPPTGPHPAFRIAL